MTARRVVALVASVVAACATRSVHRVNYADGTPRFEYEMKGGIPEGTGRTWYRSGALRSEGPYVRGARHGLFVYYDEHGDTTDELLYVEDELVWRSTNPTDAPPAQIVADLETTRHHVRSFGDGIELSHDPVPAPYFAALDSSASMRHIGFELGTGAIRRNAVFAEYGGERYGVYGQLLWTDYDTASMTYLGKRTVELGGTRRFELDNIGGLFARAGMLFPVAYDDQNGYIASAMGAQVRPSDAAASFPSAFALRTSASLVRARRYYVLQGDVGIDWVLDGQARPFDAVVRANVGVGIGVRAAMATVQLSNATSLSNASRGLDAVAFGGAFWFMKLWLTATYSIAITGQAAMMVGVGREL